ncbi:hypothetical protein ABZW18_20455 [Streptomyces sp. NPDC004647]|uniref:hypothetical protein n=1 Tax=Streptomyces sp. NPDC004647 TaxID=3154671 RepID=UPI00339EB52F
MTSKDATAGGGTWYTHETAFNQQNLGGIKQMLDGANPGLVRDIAQNWQDVHDLLIGADANSGIKKKFDDAVAKVLKTWHGKSADRFAEQAGKISENFSNGAPYAKHVAQVMGTAASQLQKAVDEITPLEEEWNFGDGFEDLHGFTMSDGDLDKLLKEGMSTEGVLKGYGGEGDAPDDLTDHQKLRLRAAIAMETLGAQYKASSASLPEPGQPINGKIPEKPEDPTGGQGPGGINPVPTGVSQRPTAGARMPSGGTGSGASSSMKPISLPDQGGISGGANMPKPTSPSMPVKTGLDGFTDGGAGGLGTGGGLGTSGGLGGGVGSGGASGGAGSGSAVSGMPGMPGGAMAGGGPRGGAGAGAGTGSRGSRAGMPGMAGGAGAGAGAGAGRAGGTGRGGSLARQAGGVAGAARGATGGGAQGGSGLHRSRGGTQAGTPGGGRGAGMMGAPGARGAGGGDEGRGGQRPDYLLEDEETWTPQRNVAPPVIE